MINKSYHKNNFNNAKIILYYKKYSALIVDDESFYFLIRSRENICNMIKKK